MQSYGFCADKDMHFWFAKQTCLANSAKY